ncbi:F-box and associated interaction domains-containing protein [Striga asiatica]|uniref:F-box and associated interaction domains-containing protein n=1 Tax=Striga asiatica TaxID=4170 RepID=A0A5A7QPT7_STRAF|nr:F-box and associated interaction domains-containing protein [Striga asiatica]
MGLPSDLQREILLRLPASSLLRFRAVCKCWCYEIDDPSFVRAHMVSNHRTSTSNSNLLLTSSNSDAIYSLPVDSLNYVDGQRTLSATRIPSALIPPGSDLLPIADSCNGLVFIRHSFLVRHKEWVIWNPLTGDYLELLPACLAFCGCWIGYDPSSDDYKVVSIGKENAHIYSLRYNSWKRIDEKCPSRVFMDAVIALDLATEKFRKLSLPCNGKPSYNWQSGVLGGCLVVFLSNDCSRAWVLKNYEALKPEWVRLFTPVGLSLIKEETRLVICRGGGVIKLWDVQSNSKKIIIIKPFPVWLPEEQEPEKIQVLFGLDGDGIGEGEEEQNRNGNSEMMGKLMSLGKMGLTLLGLCWAWIMRRKEE